MKFLGYILAATLSTACYAKYFDIITVFGGSYADLGMGYLISTAGPPNSPIPPTPPYFEGKFSDGPLYLEYLPKLIDANYPLLSVAVGGATTGTDNAEDVTNIRGLGGVATQIDRFKTTFQRINPKSLTILEAGLDNFILLIEQGEITNPAAVIESVETTISDLKSDIYGIKQLGAGQIVLFTLPDPKSVPIFQGYPPQLIVTLQEMVDVVNFELKQLPKTKNKDVFIYDFYQIANDVLTEYAIAGGNITDHTLTITSIDPYVVIENGPSPSNLAYWDGIHFTSQIQSILAKYISSVLNAPRSIGAEMDLAFLSAETQSNVVETCLANMSRNMLSCCSGPEYNNDIIFDVGGTWGTKKSKSRDFGFDYYNYHISLGIDHYFTHCLAAGILGSWIKSHGDLFHQAGNLQLQDWVPSVYAAYLVNRWGFDGQFNFHFYNFNEITRKNLVFHRKAKAKTHGFSPELSIKSSYYIPTNAFSNLTIAPFIAGDYCYIHLNGYNEHGAGVLDLKMPHQWENSLLGSIGLRIFTEACSWYNFDFQIGYEHEFLRSELDQIRPLFFDIKYNKFRYTRNGPDRDFLRFLARAYLKFAENLLFTCEYIGCYGLNAHSQYNNTAELEMTVAF